MFLVSIKQICEKVISKNPGMLQFTHNCYKTQKKYVKRQFVVILMD